MLKHDLSSILGLSGGGNSTLISQNISLTGYLNRKTEVILENGALAYEMSFLYTTPNGKNLKAGDMVSINGESFIISRLEKQANDALSRAFLSKYTAKLAKELNINDNPLRLIE